MIRPGFPVTLGHEASGVVAAIGSAVTTLKVGDRVAIEPGFPCRYCSFCLAGKYNLCPEMAFAASPGPGPVVHGTLATFFRLPSDLCYKIPDHLGLDEGVIFEPLAVAIHGLCFQSSSRDRRFLFLVQVQWVCCLVRSHANLVLVGLPWLMSTTSA